MAKNGAAILRFEDPNNLLYCSKDLYKKVTIDCFLNVFWFVNDLNHFFSAAFAGELNLCLPVRLFTVLRQMALLFTYSEARSRTKRNP